MQKIILIIISLFLINSNIYSEEISSYDSLFIMSSASNYNHQKYVEPARKKIIELKEKITPFLVSKIKSRQPREYHALRNLFKRINSIYSSKYLINELKKQNRKTFAQSAEFLGTSGYENGLEVFKEMLDTDSLWIKKSLIKGIGNLKDSNSVDILEKFVNDTNKIVRWYAVAGLGKSKSKKAVDLLFKSLDDDYQIVSHTAYLHLRGILKNDSLNRYKPMLKNNYSTTNSLFLKLKQKYFPDLKIPQNLNFYEKTFISNGNDLKKINNEKTINYIELFNSLVDSSLSYLSMSRQDMFLPLDPSKMSFVFPSVKNLFKKPMRQLDICNNEIQKYNQFPNIDFSTLRKEFELNSQTIHRKYEISINEFVSNFDGKIQILDSLFYLYSPKERTNILDKFKENLGLKSKFSERRVKPIKYDTQEEKDIADMIAQRLGERKNLKETNVFYKKTLKKLKPKYIIKAGILAYNDFLSLVNYAKNMNFDNKKIKVINTKYGDIAIGTKGNDVYEKDYFLIIDSDGDDTYDFKRANNRFSFIIDLKGNDTYKNKSFGPASTFNGISFCYDQEGDDIYKSDRFSMGSSILGFSILLDENGDDTYLSTTYSQASSIFGYACLWDKNGDDIYKSSMKSQAYSEVYGYSVLVDDMGNDSYTLSGKTKDILRYSDHYITMGQGFSIGERDAAGGGFAFLIDKAGNDSYLSDIFGGGAAYYLAYGGLIDLSGNDNYISYQYSLGSGVHLAFGTLLDIKGDDKYFSKGVSLGCGHDFAGGILLDVEGNDIYTAESLSIGSGNANAISIFADLSGNDIYEAQKNSTMGYSDVRRDAGYIGIFIDNAGDDKYASPFGKGRSIWYNGTWGVGMDRGNK